MMAYTLSLVALAILFFVNRSQHAKIHEDHKMQNNPLTSHVLDTATGVPAKGVHTSLYRLVKQEWVKIVDADTNADGRLSNLLKSSEFSVGVYKMFFDTKAYYDNLKMKTFYPYVEIVFEIENPSEHYHVPLLLSPYGYSTYRGS